MQEKSDTEFFGVPLGCGTVCRSCDRDTREFCWVTKGCELELSSIGSPARSLKTKRKKSDVIY